MRKGRLAPAFLSFVFLLATAAEATATAATVAGEAIATTIAPAGRDPRLEGRTLLDDRATDVRVDPLISDLRPIDDWTTCIRVNALVADLRPVDDRATSIRVDTLVANLLLVDHRPASIRIDAQVAILRQISDLVRTVAVLRERDNRTIRTTVAAIASDDWTAALSAKPVLRIDHWTTIAVVIVVVAVLAILREADHRTATIAAGEIDHRAIVAQVTDLDATIAEPAIAEAAFVTLGKCDVHEARTLLQATGSANQIAIVKPGHEVRIGIG